MRRLLLFLIFSPFVLFAQTKFGYFSYGSLLESMPQYKSAMEDYNNLRLRCEKEIERNEQELTRYYVAYLDGYRSFPEPILLKRQNELQQMIDNSVVFRDNLKKWLVEAKDSLCASCHLAIDSAIVKVSTAMNLAYVIDADCVAYRYINPNVGIEITDILIEAVNNPDTFSITRLWQLHGVPTEVDTPVILATPPLEEVLKSDAVGIDVE